MITKRANTQIRQYQIVEAVRNLIASSGMEYVTIETIAREAGLTKGLSTGTSTANEAFS